MFQCLGLETEQNGGCGEDWYHPECLLGLPRDWHLSKYEHSNDQKDLQKNLSDSALEKASEEDLDHPIPPRFPQEDQIESLICYKCTETNLWLKRYAGTKGFLGPLYYGPVCQPGFKEEQIAKLTVASQDSEIPPSLGNDAEHSKKRKIESDETNDEPALSKKMKVEPTNHTQLASTVYHDCRKSILSEPSAGSFSLVASDEDFRTNFCRCAECYLSLKKYPQLLEEEDAYEPPLSEASGDGEGEGSIGTGSLLERGEAALSNVDRVRAIGK